MKKNLVIFLFFFHECKMNEWMNDTEETRLWWRSWVCLVQTQRTCFYGTCNIYYYHYFYFYFLIYYLLIFTLHPLKIMNKNLWAKNNELKFFNYVKEWIIFNIFYMWPIKKINFFYMWLYLFLFIYLFYFLFLFFSPVHIVDTHHQTF